MVISILKNGLLLPLWLVMIMMSIFFSYNLIVDVYIENYGSFLFFLYGILAYMVSLIFIKHCKYDFWNTLRHEFLHAVFALLIFSKTHKLVASTVADENNHLGFVLTDSSRTNIGAFFKSHLVSLAPYFMPFFTILLCGLYLLIKPEEAGFIEQMFIADYSSKGILLIIGFIYCYELYTSFSEAKPYQSDFSYLGYRYGMMFVIMVQSVCFLLVIYLLSIDLDSTASMIETFEALSENIVSYVS